MHIIIYFKKVFGYKRNVTMKHVLENIKMICEKYGKPLMRYSAKQKNKTIITDFFKDGNEQITDKLEIANRFNVFFTNIGIYLANKLVNQGNKIFTDFLVHKYTSQLKFQNINKEQVIKIIGNMKPKTSFGFDKISMKLPVIKSIKNVLAEPLTIVINQMLNTSQVAAIWY